MSHPSSPLERLERALTAPSRGAVGLVDELLAVSRGQEIHLDWHEGRCRLNFPGGSPTDRIELPLPKSVVRAALARVAALCNERDPDAVSPFGGEGEVMVGTDSPRGIWAAFINTPERQSLDLMPMRPGERRSQSLPLEAIVEGRREGAGG